MIKILELFGGIGACSKALKKLGIPFEIADYVEIDKYAVASFNAINNTNFKAQDISNWNKTIDVDLIMHGSPCQDFSLAGKQAGGDKNSGTRSSLMYETLRIVENLKPKYVIWENVKNLVSKKHIHNFKEYIYEMEKIGYKNYYKILNEKDYGIPQNRERVFTISIRNDIKKDFKFPKKQEMKLKLKDFLDEKVEDKYFLSNEKIERIANWKSYQKPFKKVNGNNSIIPTITARGAGEEHSGMITYCPFFNETKDIQEKCLNINNATKKGYLEAKDGDGINISSRMKYQRGNVQRNIIQTITTSGGNDRAVLLEKDNQLKIRKLTPRECWKLMGFEDDDYEKVKNINSPSQLYKQAGNSIVVNVLENIFKILLKEEL